VEAKDIAFGFSSSVAREPRFLPLALFSLLYENGFIEKRIRVFLRKERRAEIVLVGLGQ
jgi:hypothetical protein